VDIKRNYKVPLIVLSSFEETECTLIICKDKKMEQPVVSGIAFNRNEAKLTIMGVPDIPGVAARILEPISKANIDIDMIIQNIGVDGLTDFTFTVNREDYTKASDTLERIRQELGAEKVLGDTKIVKISLVGVGMRSNTGIASKMFGILGQEGINIQLISTSEIKVSVVVAERYLELGVRALHAGFSLDKSPEEQFDPIRTVDQNVDFCITRV